MAKEQKAQQPLSNTEKNQDMYEISQTETNINTNAVLPIGDRTEILQEHSKFKPINELALKEYIIAGSGTIKYETDNPIDTDIEGFTI
ncbi:12973_t:CDS:2, partial [Gigaspora margarita]